MIAALSAQDEGSLRPGKAGDAEIIKKVPFPQPQSWPRAKEVSDNPGMAMRWSLAVQVCALKNTTFDTDLTRIETDWCRLALGHGLSSQMVLAESMNPLFLDPVNFVIAEEVSEQPSPPCTHDAHLSLLPLPGINAPARARATRRASLIIAVCTAIGRRNPGHRADSEAGPLFRASILDCQAGDEGKRHWLSNRQGASRRE